MDKSSRSGSDSDSSVERRRTKHTIIEDIKEYKIDHIQLVNGRHLLKTQIPGGNMIIDSFIS